MWLRLRFLRWRALWRALWLCELLQRLWLRVWLRLLVRCLCLAVDVCACWWWEWMPSKHFDHVNVEPVCAHPPPIFSHLENSVHQKQRLRPIEPPSDLETTCILAPMTVRLCDCVAKVTSA